MSKVEYSVRLRKLRDGAPGQASFKSIVFKRAASNPGAPTGGSFASPVPSGWQDGIPPESGGSPCWMTSRVFTSDSQSPQDAAWKTPALIADTADIDFCFSSLASPGNPPDEHPVQNTGGWHDVGAEDDIWMAVARCSNGQWGEWSVSKIKGEDGVGAYALDLDNEMVNIGLTSADDKLYPAAGYNTGSSGIYVAGGASSSAALARVEAYIGDTRVAYATTLSGGTYSSATLGITSLALSAIDTDANTSSISLTLSTTKERAQGERIEVKLKATIAVSDSAGSRSVYAYKVLTVVFQPPGADGVSPTVYELKPSHNYVSVSADGTRTPSSVTCSVTRRVGNSYKVLDASEVSAAGLEVKYVKTIGGKASPPTSGTSATTAGADGLVWHLYHGDDLYDKEEIAFVKDGENGTSPILLDLDNESETVPVDIHGVPLAGALASAVSQATLYVGSSAAPTQPTWSVAAENCVASVSDTGLVSVTSLEPSAKSASVAVTASYGGGDYTAVFSIAKAYPGSDGQPATVYRVNPSATAVSKNASGAVSPSSVSCSVTKRVGTAAAVSADGEKYLAYFITTTAGSSSQEYAYTGPVSAYGSVRSITFILYEDSTKAVTLDKETVPVVSDGAKGDPGDNGENAVVAVASPASITYTAGEFKVVPMDVFIMDGGERKDPTSITALIGNTSGTYRGVEWHGPSESFRIDSGAYFEGVATLRLGYNGKTYDASVQFNRVLNGDPGPAGLVYRKTEWADGVEYRNDAALLKAGADASLSQNGDGVWYLDIVTKTDSDGKLIGVWECALTHTSQAAYDPESEDYGEGDTSAHWRKFSNLGTQPLYTPLILADGACIGFIQGQQLKIFDTAGSLKAGVSAASGSYPVFYANPTGQDTTTARWQQFENGNAQFGDPAGAKMFLNAAPGSGLLPRMEVYNMDGNVSAIFDGSTITSIGQVLGQGSDSGSIAAQRLTATLTNVASMETVVSVRSAALGCTSESILTVSSGSFLLWGEAAETPKGDNDVYVTVTIYVDGIAKKTAQITIPNGTSIAQSNAQPFTIPAVSMSVGAGGHYVEIELAARRDVNAAGVSYTAKAELQLVSALSIGLAASVQRCRYFANGMIIGSTANNYFMAWNNSGGNMNFVCENPTAGIKVTDTGVYIKRGGSWDNNPL